MKQQSWTEAEVKNTIRKYASILYSNLKINAFEYADIISLANSKQYKAAANAIKIANSR